MRTLMWRKAGAALTSAGAVVLIGSIIVLSGDFGPQARHMGLHIFSMNVVAPVVAGIVAAHWPVHDAKPSWLWIMTVAQIAVVWLAHAPSVQAAALAFPGIQLATHGVLLAAALSFWILLLSLPEARRWHAIPALLLTGKLVCLLAVLLVFAPRALYGTSHGHGLSIQPLDDQHLAGLLMIAACPLSYLVAAVVITVQLLNRDHAAHAALRQRPAHGAG
jgi:putative membrane protein